jgi:hypothetical protein
LIRAEERAKDAIYSGSDLFGITVAHWQSRPHRRIGFGIASAFKEELYGS